MNPTNSQSNTGKVLGTETQVTPKVTEVTATTTSTATPTPTPASSNSKANAGLINGKYVFFFL